MASEGVFFFVAFICFVAPLNVEANHYISKELDKHQPSFETNSLPDIDRTDHKQVVGYPTKESLSKDIHPNGERVESGVSESDRHSTLDRPLKLVRVSREPLGLGSSKIKPSRLLPRLTSRPRPTTTTTSTTTTTESPSSGGNDEGLEEGDDVIVETEGEEDDEDLSSPNEQNDKAKFKDNTKSRSDEDERSGSNEVDRKSESESNKTAMETMNRKRKPLLKLAFIKPKNESVCIPEAYLEFPQDLIGNKWRSRGLVFVHIAVVCYMFYSLALVCERYFMPSLEEFSQRLNLSDDVAGATLMSAGSSAPELFTAILGVFIAKGDVGTGAIVGSAVFNILFVIGICAFVSTTNAQLSWWPVLRDSVFYTFTVLVLILFIYDERVTALESFTMIALYGVYILIMAYNDRVREYVTIQLQSNPITAKLVSSTFEVDEVFGAGGDSAGGETSKKGFFDSQRNYQTTSMIQRNDQKTVEDDAMFLAAMLVIVKHKRLFRSQLRFQSAARYIITKRQHRAQNQRQPKNLATTESNEVNYFGPEDDAIDQPGSKIGTTNQRDRMEAYAKSATVSKNKFSIVSKDDYEFWNRRPAEGENYYIWLSKIPVNYVLHYTTPDCTLYPDKYLLTFFVSIAWTAFFSYIMVWMVTLIGYTFGIPDSVMGVTFLAAGTSVPDCYSSIHAARNGMADMAVSNSIGSNVFDILIGLSLPWFIQTAIYPGVVATINSRGVIYSVILLFLTLFVTIYMMNKYEWTLKPRLGLALLIAYILFIVLTCMLEFNLLGHVNPPPCPIP